jgi:hypothetical protein
MSVKIAQNVAQPIFVKKLPLECGPLPIFSKKLPKVNGDLIGEKSGPTAGETLSNIPALLIDNHYLF